MLLGKLQCGLFALSWILHLLRDDDNLGASHINVGFCSIYWKYLFETYYRLIDNVTIFKRASRCFSHGCWGGIQSAVGGKYSSWNFPQLLTGIFLSVRFAAKRIFAFHLASSASWVCWITAGPFRVQLWRKGMQSLLDSSQWQQPTSSCIHWTEWLNIGRSFRILDDSDLGVCFLSFMLIFYSIYH